jgi:hypothetical protein
MIQETPQTTNPPPEAQSPASGQTREEPGLFCRWLNVWRDRTPELEERDTSSWNIYYYFYRQVAQHHAMLKLKYLKWFALLINAYYFLSFALVLLTFWSHRGSDGFGTTGFNRAFASLVGWFYGAPYILLALFLFIPAFMVGSAFKLRSRFKLFMTSRSKDPPLVAHLVQYTSGDTLVQGAMQSLLYTWGRFFLLLLPSIIATVVALALMFLTETDETSAWVLYISLPLILTLLGITFSIFLVMQKFCFRLDSLIIMGAVILQSGVFLFGILVHFVHIMQHGIRIDREFWFPLLLFFLPSCIFAWFYFPLAATDTNAYGLGKRVSKWIRAVLFSLAGFFIAMLFVRNSIGYVIIGEQVMVMGVNGFYNLFEIFGLIVTVCCLLVTSVSMTSYHAERLSRIRSGDSLLRRIFDPASPLSLVPVFLLEAVVIAVVFFWDKLFLQRPGAMAVQAAGKNKESFMILSLLPYALLPWAVLHFGLLIAFTKQRFKHDMKPAWISHVPFNMVCIILGVLTMLGYAMFSRLALVFSIIDYIISIVIWCFIVLIEKQYSGRDKDLEPGHAPMWEQEGKTP